VKFVHLAGFITKKRTKSFEAHESLGPC